MANDTTKRAIPEFTELGLSGLKRFSGYVFDEPLREMQGDRWRKTIAEMELDPIIGAELFAIDMMIRRVEWKIPEPEAASDKTIYEFVQSCFDDMNQPWSETVSEILTMLPFGWANFEQVYKVRQGDQSGKTQPDVNGQPVDVPSSKHEDGLIGWRKWGIRAQESLFRWEFDDKGGIKGMYQLAAPNYQLVFIPIEKSLLFRTTSRKGNPEGRSVLRSAYRPWYIKRNIENVQGIAAERIYNGIPIAWVPAEIVADDADTNMKAQYALFKNIVTNLRNDELMGLVLPQAYDENGNPMYSLQLLSPNGTQQVDMESVIQRNNQTIAATVLADFILLGHENVGSFALGQSKSDLFIAALDAWLKAIADVINRYAIPRLLKLNGMKPKKMPELTHGEITKISLEELSSFVTQMNSAGMPLFPDTELEQYLRDQASLPKATGTAVNQMQQQMLLMQAQSANEQKQAEKPKQASENVGITDPPMPIQIHIDNAGPKRASEQALLSALSRLKTALGDNRIGSH